MCNPLFDEVEALFFKCTTFTDKHKQNSMPGHTAQDQELHLVNGGAEEDVLSAEISDLLNGQRMQAALAANWEVKIGIESMLRSALRSSYRYIYIHLVPSTQKYDEAFFHLRFIEI